MPASQVRLPTRRGPALVAVVATAVALAAGVAVPAAVAATASAAVAAPAPATAALPRAAGTLVPATLFGMHNARTGSSAARVGSLRVTWQAEWRHNEPRRGRFDWRDLDAELATARRAGIRDVLLMIGLTPDWATARGANRPGTVDAPARLSDWERWVDVVSRRYAGRGVSYQIWNEANLRTFWSGTPEQMARLVARAYPIIKRNDPGARVVAPSTTTRIPTSLQRFYPRFLAALRSYGWPVDVFSAHLYPPSTGGPVQVQQYVGQLRRLLRAAGAPPRPLWNTEINYGLAGPGPSYPHRTITGATAAAWVSRTYLDSVRLGVARAYWYMQARPDSLLGIQMWTAQPGLTAERTTYAWLAGRHWNGCSRTGAVLSCRTTAGSTVATIMWSESAPATVTAPTGTRHRCDALGRCRSHQAGARVAVTQLPVRFTP